MSKWNQLQVGMSRVNLQGRYGHFFNDWDRGPKSTFMSEHNLSQMHI